MGDAGLEPATPSVSSWWTEATQVVYLQIFAAIHWAKPFSRAFKDFLCFTLVANSFGALH